jgi:hypothetical protein
MKEIDNKRFADSHGDHLRDMQYYKREDAERREWERIVSQEFLKQFDNRIGGRPL